MDSKQKFITMTADEVAGALMNDQAYDSLIVTLTDTAKNFKKFDEIFPTCPEPVGAQLAAGVDAMKHIVELARLGAQTKTDSRKKQKVAE